MREGVARRTASTAVALAAALLVCAGAGSAGASKGGANPGRAAVVAYWTPDRIAHAIPREVSPRWMPDLGQPGPDAQKGKPGGGGGGSTTVAGSGWSGGGLVKQTTGKVLFTMGGVDYVCSGSVADDTSTSTSLILTAGHCVYDEGGTGWATNWMFVPDYENGGSILTNQDGSHSFTCNTVPYGCWTATRLVTTSAWAAGNGSLAGFNNDYAFAVVGPGGKTGESVQLDDTVGSNPVDFNRSHPTQVYAFGYPHAAPYDGQKLVYCAGKDIADTWGGTTGFGLNCNMTGGSSGGPWFVDFDASAGTGKLNSLNSFKYTAGKFTKYMFGPYFGSYAQKTYGAAQQATTANTLVTP